jgi:O-antigen ligase
MTETVGVPFETLLVYGMGALVASMLLVVAMGVSLHADLALRRFYVPVVTAGITVVPALAVLISSRDVTSIDFAALDRATGAATMFLRLSSMALVGLTCVRILSYVLAGSRHATPPGPGGLLLAFVAFVVAHHGLNAVFGSHPSLPEPQAMYATLVLVGIYVSRQTDLRVLVLAAKWALLMVMAGSLLWLVLDPGVVRQEAGAELRIPGVTFRLFGLGSNPNSIATLALLALLLSVYRPFRPWPLEVANAAAALAVLVLAQSQTAWLATLVALPVLLIGRADFRLLDRRPLLVSLAGLALMAAAALGAGFFVGPDLSIDSIASGSRYRELTTLTGRLAIWDVALAEWRDNLLFGYGPSVWDKAFRARIGMDYAFTAHNQFLQSLSAAGLVGLATTVTYLATLAWLSFTAPRPERGLALALLAILAARILTETPLHIATPFANEFLPHYLLFAVLAFTHTRVRAAHARTVRVRVRPLQDPPVEPVR